MTPDTANLFERLPSRIFGPLAGESRERSWHLLIHLYHEFFSPDASIPDGEGWTKAELSQSVQRFLYRFDARQDDDSVPETPIDIRAADLLGILNRSGWLNEERVGLVSYVVMAPTVQEFLELLQSFAESSPDMVAGRIQTIYNNIHACEKDPGNNAPAYADSAKQCAQLVRLLNNMRLRARELMQVLRKNTDTGSYTLTYFEKFVGEYLSQYYDLMSGNHPLARRWDVIQCANRLYDDEDKLAVLTRAYAEQFKLTPQAAAERVEVDHDRYQSLIKLDDLLQRLNDSVAMANQQALSFFRYRMRARVDIDRFVDTAVDALLAQDNARSQDDAGVTVAMGFADGHLFHEGALKLTVAKRARPRRSVNKPPVLTLEQQAARILRRIVTGHRKVSAARMVAYVDKHLLDKPSIQSADFQVEGINDLCLLAGLTRVGIVASRLANTPRGARLNRYGILYASLLRRYDVQFTGERFQNRYLDAPAIKISRK